MNAFVCDLTIDDLCAHVAPSSVDVVTMVIVMFIQLVPFYRLVFVHLICCKSLDQ